MGGKGSFFCEACGAEVKGRADRCPQCGRSFLGVRCPRCGREGSSDDFIRGCPDCGYLAPVGNERSGETRPAGNGRRVRRKHREWPARLYWILSGLIVTAVGIVLLLWL